MKNTLNVLKSSVMPHTVLLGALMLIPVISSANDDTTPAINSSTTPKIQLDINHITDTLNKQHSSVSPLVKSARLPMALSVNSNLLFSANKNSHTKKSTKKKDVLQHLTSVASTSVSNFRQTGNAIALDSDLPLIGYTENKTRLTASHKSLPIGTEVKVTNKNNGKSVIVKISNNRSMTAHKNKILSLSRNAARKIGIINKGVSKVLIEKIR